VDITRNAKPHQYLTVIARADLATEFEFKDSNNCILSSMNWG